MTLHFSIVEVIKHFQKCKTSVAEKTPMDRQLLGETLAAARAADIFMG